MSAQGLGQKLIEWAVIAALVGVVGYLIGNSDAATMRAEIDRLKADNTRLEASVNKLRSDVDLLSPRVLTIEIEARTERSERMKGDAP